MDIQSIWESIELDKRQLKCLIDAFKSEPDAELQSLLKRNVEQMQARLIQLVEAVDATSLKNDEAMKETPQATEPLIVPTSSPKIEVPLIKEEESKILPEKENTPITPIKEPEAFIMDEDDYLSHEKSEPILGERVVIESDSVNIPLSLNDLFRFAREWFDGDTAKFNSMWSVFASIDNYDDAEAYLHTCIKSDDEDETMADCLALLRRHYQA